MVLTSARSRLATAVLAASASAGCHADVPPNVGASSSPEAEVTTISAIEARAQVDRIAAALACDRTLALHDDVWFGDRAVGVICDRGDGEPVRVYVYRRSGSAATAVAEQGPIDGVVRIVDSHVLVAGPEDVLGTLAGDLKLPAAIDAVDERPLSAKEDALNFCARAVAAHVTSTMDGESEAPDDIESLNSLFDGYGRLVEDLDRGLNARRWNALKSKDPLAAESRLSALGPLAKDMCEKKEDDSWAPGEKWTPAP